MRYGWHAAVGLIFAGSILLQNAGIDAGALLLLGGGLLMAYRGVLAVGSPEALRYAQEREAESLMGRAGHRFENRFQGGLFVAIGLAIALFATGYIVQAAI